MGLQLSSWQQGAMAARDGVPITACPYPHQEYDFVTWVHGWAAAANGLARGFTPRDMPFVVEHPNADLF